MKMNKKDKKKIEAFVRWIKEKNTSYVLWI